MTFFYQNKANRSAEFENFGLDFMESVGATVTDQSVNRGLRQGSALSGLTRMDEIQRARDLATMSEQELQDKYNPYANLAVTQEMMDMLDPDTYLMAQSQAMPSLGDWEGFPDQEIRTLSAEEANTRFSVDGRLRFEDGVTNLEAWILQQRKIEEVRFNHVLERANGAQFWKGMGVEMGMALVDPLNLAIGIVAAPLGATALLGKMGVTAGSTGLRAAIATRSVYGGLGGLYSGVLTEPLIYAANSQEQADYGVVNSLFNIAFSTAGGAGLANAFGALGSGVARSYRYVSRRRNNAAITAAVNQLDNGMDVEVNPILHAGDQPEAPVATPVVQAAELPVSAEGQAALAKMAAIVDEDAPPAPRVDTTPENAPLAPVKNYEPAADSTAALKKIDAVEKAIPLTRAKMTKLVAEDADLKEALLETLQPSSPNAKPLQNKFAFRIVTKDGQVLLVQSKVGKGLSLLDSDSIATIDPSNPIVSLSESIHSAAMMHGADISEANFAYHGSYGDLQPGSVHHVIDILGATFDEGMNVNSVVLAAPQEVPKLFEGSPIAQAFSGYTPKGKSAVMSLNQAEDTIQLGMGQEGGPLEGFDVALNADNLKQTGQGMGTQKGGVFEDKGTGTQFYVKFPDNPDQAVNEFLAASMYRLFGVEFPNTRLVMKEGKVVGVASEMMPGAKMITPDEFVALPEAIKADFIKSSVVDMYLGNWDVVGNGPNYNIMQLPSGKIVRIDPGGALNYRAQGAAKQLSDDLAELKTMLDDSVAPTAAKVFKSATGSGAEWRGLVSEAVDAILTTPPRVIDELIAGVGIKDADKLIKVLELRRAALEKRFPDVAKQAVMKHQKYFQAFSKSEGLAHIQNQAKRVLPAYTKAEVDAIRKYGGPYSEEINAYSQLTPEQQAKYAPDSYSKAYDLLVQAFARAESEITKPLRLFRGGTPTSAFNGINGHNLSSATDIQTARAMIGGKVKWNIFMSTSVDEHFATNWKPHMGPLIEFRDVPVGTKAIYGNKSMFPHLQSEAEVLLNRGLTLKVVNATTLKSGRVKFIVDVLPENYVEPPKMTQKQIIKMAQHHRANGQTNATSDTQVKLDGEDDSFIQAVLRAGETYDEMSKLDADIETLKADVLAELQNMDDTLAAAFAKELQAADADAAVNAAYFQDLHKAAKAAAVCVRGAGA